MTIRVGEVIAINGVRVTLKIDEDSSKDTLFFQGERYKGISIREYITIQRGFRNIICLVEGEHLDESRVEGTGPKVSYVRKVEAKPIGHFNGDVFEHGIKHLPMIKDSAYLLSERMVTAIYGRSSGNGFVIGRTLKEDVPIGLPWAKLFNSHIGIFGNTGSGKSNTLAKLYTVLFEKKSESIGNRSSFVVMDFNGEYTGLQLVPADLKAVYRLSTQGQGRDKFPLNSSEFWDTETLAILFQATTNTQKPFLTRLVDGRNTFPTLQALSNYAKTTFRAAFSAVKQRPEALDLLRKLSRVIQHDNLVELLKEVTWHNGASTFAKRRADYTYAYFNADGVEYDALISTTVETIDLTNLDPFDQLIVRAYIQLIRELVQGFVQFDHIQPLIKRIEASLTSLKKVLFVGEVDPPQKLVAVISLKQCNNESKKVLPLLLAKHYYYRHRNTVAHPPNSTLHLIIDEARRHPAFSSGSI